MGFRSTLPFSNKNERKSSGDFLPADDNGGLFRLSGGVKMESADNKRKKKVCIRVMFIFSIVFSYFACKEGKYVPFYLFIFLILVVFVLHAGVYIGHRNYDLESCIGLDKRISPESGPSCGSGWFKLTLFFSLWVGLSLNI